MGFLPKETVVAGILAAFAAHPELIPPHLLQAHSDSNLDDIYRLPDVHTFSDAAVRVGPVLKAFLRTSTRTIGSVQPNL
jgi:hypothetical protein